MFHSKASSRHHTSVRSSIGLAAFFAAALVAATTTQSLVEGPAASADASAQLTSDCANRTCGATAQIIKANSAGTTQGVNPGAPGQCTWGAAQKWFEVSGSYPALSGNALSWADSATAAGWTVVDGPQARSIVVFQPGVAGAGPIGHVAWVDSVTQRSDGQVIHVTEMNNVYYGGVGIFSERDIMNVPGMSYILLP